MDFSAGNGVEASTTDRAVFRLVPAGGPVRRSYDEQAALRSFVASLKHGQRIEITFAFKGDRMRSAELSLAFHSLRPWSLAEMRSHEQVAALIFPGFAPKNAELHLPFARTALRQPQLDVSDVLTSSKNKPSPIAGPRATATTLIISRTAPATWRLVDVLHAVAGMDGDAALTISLEPFARQAAASRACAIALPVAIGRLAETRATSPKRAELERVLAALNAWDGDPPALQLGFTLHAATPPGSAFVSMLSSILFQTSCDARLVSGDGLDVSRAVTENESSPSLLPDSAAMTGLGFHRVVRGVETPGPTMAIGKDARERVVDIPRADLSRHVYIVGATGTGKSTLIANMIRQDVEAGIGGLLIDPHGDLFNDVAESLPADARRTTLIASASDFEHPFGLNLLDIEAEPVAVQRNFVANQLLYVLKRLLYPGCPEAFGPMFEAYFRNALLLLMTARGPEANLIDLDRVFADHAWRKWLLGKCDDPVVVRFWRDIAGRAGGEGSLENVAPYVCSKLTQITGNPLLRPILTSAGGNLDIRSAMRDKRLVLCNLAKGQVGAPDAAFLGAILTIRVFADGLARAPLAPSQRPPFRLYLDEFQNYAGDTLATMLAECRKFGIELVLANQSLEQVSGRGADIGHALLANVGSTIAFRLGPRDALSLVEWFNRDVSTDELMRQPDHHCLARLLRHGRPTEAIRLSCNAPAWRGPSKLDNISDE